MCLNLYNREFPRKVYLGIIVLTTLNLIFSCEGFVEVDPPISEIVAETVYNNDQSAISAMRGIYSNLIQSGFASGDSQSITVYGGLSSDEFVPIIPNNELFAINNNSLLPTNSAITTLWNDSYQTIFAANAILDGISRSSSLSDNVRNQLEGESKFIRAFIHFYLVNLFGEVPYIKTTDFEVNNEAVRATVSDVYENIILDLIDAQSLLQNDYSFSNGERVQPNEAVTNALLARAYLFIGDWVNAETESSKVISNPNFQLANSLEDVFLANSSECIWQLRPVIPGQNTNEGPLFAFNSTGLPNSFQLTIDLADSFLSNDLRRGEWISDNTVEGVTYFVPSKYKVTEPNQPLTEYSMVLRLAEQYLIRAEARAHLGKLNEAQSDINRIRNRAGLDNTMANDLTSLLIEIEQEKRHELFSEWGHRWLDLKRLGRVDEVFSGFGTKDWQSTDQLYPIPFNELENNPNMTQNPGY